MDCGGQNLDALGQRFVAFRQSLQALVDIHTTILPCLKRFP
jgi:hypothetical protein